MGVSNPFGEIYNVGAGLLRSDSKLGLGTDPTTQLHVDTTNAGVGVNAGYFIRNGEPFSGEYGTTLKAYTLYRQTAAGPHTTPDTGFTAPEVGGSTLEATCYYGTAAYPARGNFHTFQLNCVVQATDSGGNEPTASQQIIRDDTPPTTPHPRLWFGDWWVIGCPANEQNYAINGPCLFLGNYYNGSPAETDSYGMFITTAIGATTGIANHNNLDTYPFDVGLGISGATGRYGFGAGTVYRQSFKTALKIGGGASSTAGDRFTWVRAQWLNDSAFRARIGTGIEIRDFEDGGIKIWKRYPASTGKSLSLSWDDTGAASTSVNDGIDFGGDIQIWRAGSNELRIGQTGDVIKISTNTHLHASGIVSLEAVGGTGYYQMREQTSAVAAPPADYGQMYIRNNKLTFAYKDGATTKYLTTDLTVAAGAAAWDVSTSAP
jgi:hypothetical protein